VKFSLQLEREIVQRDCWNWDIGVRVGLCRRLIVPAAMAERRERMVDELYIATESIEKPEACNTRN
jgi:hypothetical protein